MPIEPCRSSEDNGFFSQNFKLRLIYTFRLIFDASLKAMRQCGSAGIHIIPPPHQATTTCDTYYDSGLRNLFSFEILIQESALY